MELVKKYNKKFNIGDFSFDENLLVIAGPCSIESEEQMETVALRLIKNNIRFIRAYPYKPRTSPYSFQGLGEEGFNIIRGLRKKYNIKIVSEILDAADLDFYLENVDIIQVGARNMQNFALLKALGKIKKPVLLKRGFGNTIEEWLNACEYLLKSGNDQVILCERGIKTFENMTRNTLDISSIPIVKGLTKIPIIADPSHASGRSDLVKPLSLAAIAAGADGIMVEVHPEPTKSVSDKDQAISLDEFEVLINEIKNMAILFHKKLD